MNPTTSTSKTTSPEAGPLFGLGIGEEKSTLPLLQQLSAQIGAALRTGGVGAQQPMANAAQAGQRSAASTAQTQTAEKLAAGGVSGSESAGTLGAEAATSGATIAGIPANIAQQFIGMAPAVAGITGEGPMTAAGNLNRTTTTTTQPGFWDTFNQGLSGFSSGTGSYVGSKWP